MRQLTFRKEDGQGQPREEIGIAIFTLEQVWMHILTSEKIGMATLISEEERRLASFLRGMG